jgi:HK97 gp10 family phage protein
MQYNGITFELGVRETSGLAANFYAADREVTRAMKRVMRDGAELVRDVTQALAPIDTGFMQENVEMKISRGGLAFEVGWDAAKFFAIGEAFYPFFQEFGTVKMRAQPSLGPAYRYAEPIIRADTRAVITAAIERLNRRGR